MSQFDAAYMRLSCLFWTVSNAFVVLAKPTKIHFQVSRNSLNSREMNSCNCSEAAIESTERERREQLHGFGKLWERHDSPPRPFAFRISCSTKIRQCIYSSALSPAAFHACEMVLFMLRSPIFLSLPFPLIRTYDWELLACSPRWIKLFWANSVRYKSVPLLKCDSLLFVITLCGRVNCLLVHKKRRKLHK